MAIAEPAAASSSASLVAGPSAYHESSQFRHWRYSPAQLREIRQGLNEKCIEVVQRNQELEKEAQLSLGHDVANPAPHAAYLSVEEERLLVHHYCIQASNVAKAGFEMPLPEVVEATAISYLKRFYLKNSVMEWHPKVIMPTCVYLAAKTTNHFIIMERFKKTFKKPTAQEILDTEFAVAQALSFEFWTRGAEKGLRGWALELQTQDGADTARIQQIIPKALEHLSASRLTDAEFIYSPSQISLACFRAVDRALIEDFLTWKYASKPPPEDPDPDAFVYGIEQARLATILDEIEDMIKDSRQDLDLKVLKGIDKRLKGCTNPEKTEGTALYIKRKQERDAAEAAVKATKADKLRKEMSDRDTVFGDVIQSMPKKVKAEPKAMSPRVSLGSDRPLSTGFGGPADDAIGRTGMGVREEAMGLLVGGKGLKDVGGEIDE